MSTIACINIQQALLNSKINTRASRLYLTLPIICAIFFKQLTIFRVNVMSLSKRNFGPTPPLWFPFFDTHERETGTIMKKGQWRFPWVRCSCELVFVNRVLSTTVSLSMRNCQSLPPKLRLRGHNCTLSMIIVQFALLRAILNWKNA